MRKSIIYLMMAILLVSNVLALGLVPAETKLQFASGLEKEVKLKLFNNENTGFNAVVYAEGDLAEYIMIPDNLITFKPGEREKVISYTIKLPENMQKEGTHSAKIVVRAISSEKDSTVTANLAVASKLYVNVPYTGRHAEIQLFIPPKIEKRKETRFSIEAVNIGTEDIIKARAIIEIFDFSGNRIDALTTDEVSIAAKEKQHLTAKWIPAAGNGAYKAIATLFYDGQSTKTEKPFNIGTLSIEVISISVDKFKLGGIAKFSIFIENKWNDNISDVHAEVLVKDKDQKILTTYKTASTSIESYGKNILEAYWDTDKVLPGKYIMDIILNYIGTSSEHEFDILVEEDNIQTLTTGKAISVEQEEENRAMKAIYVLSVVVVLLIVFNVYMLAKKRKNK